MVRIGVFIACVAFLSGCALLPIPPNPKDEDVIKKSTIPVDGNTAVDLLKAKQLLSGWKHEYEEANLGRREWQVGLDEVLFYGSILTVLGASAATRGARHLRNLGIVGAGGAGLMQGHYQLGAQQTAFRKAITKLSCMETALIQITPANQRAFPDIAASLKAILANLPATILSNIDAVRTELGNTLNAITLSTPTKDEIASSFEKWKNAKEKAPNTPTSAGEKSAAGGFLALSSPSVPELNALKQSYEQALNKVTAEFEVCLKTEAK